MLGRPNSRLLSERGDSRLFGERGGWSGGTSYALRPMKGRGWWKRDPWSEDPGSTAREVADVIVGNTDEVADPVPFALIKDDDSFCGPSGSFPEAFLMRFSEVVWSCTGDLTP